MTATKPLGTYGNAVGTVTPLDHKMAQSGLIVKTSTANLIRAGLFYNGTSTIVSGTANMSYNVAAFTAALTRGATAGTVLLANDATYNVVTTAAPGSNSRYDVVYVWAREFSIDGTDSNPVIGVVQGTPAASPTVPSLSAFPGAVELARILVPSGVTATNSGTTITQKAPFTATAGGVIPFRTTTERDEGTYNEGQYGWLIDSNTVEFYNGTSWVLLAGARVARRRASANVATGGTFAALTLGTSIVDGGSFSYSGGTFTCVTAGSYKITYTVTFAANVTGIRYARLNSAVGTPPTQTYQDSISLPVTLTMTWIEAFTAAQTFITEAAQTSGGNLGVSAGIDIERLV